ncbi:MAG: hypothetical protein QXW70_03880 [Candidatus Anstonellales archaeon]
MDAEEEKGERIAEKAVKEGGVQAILYYDIHGTSPEALRNIMVGFVGKLLAEEGVLYSYGKIEAPQKDSETENYYTSAEVKMVFRDFNSLAMLCAKYLPIGIEILKPNEIKMKVGEAQNMLLNIASIANEYAEELLKRTMDKDELRKYQEKIIKREELGRKLLEKKAKELR